MTTINNLGHPLSHGPLELEGYALVPLPTCYYSLTDMGAAVVILSTTFFSP